MPPYSRLVPKQDDKDGNIKALAFFVEQAVQLYNKLEPMRSYPENFLSTHHTGVSNWQALSVLIGFAKNRHEAARSSFPEGGGSLADPILSQYCTILTYLSNTLEQDGPRRAATIVVQMERPMNPEFIRRCLEERGIRTRMFGRSGDDQGHIRADEASVLSVDGLTLVSQEGAIAEASVDNDTRKAGPSTKKPEDGLVKGGTWLGKPGGRLRKHASESTAFIGRVLKAFACYENGSASSQ